MHNFISKKKYGIKGYYTYEIVREFDLEVVSKSKSKNNTILNQGIDYASAFAFASCIDSVVIGSSTIAPNPTDTGLGNELLRSNLPDHSVSVPCGYNLTGNILSIYKTYRLPTVSQPTAFGEIGWSPYNFAGANLFSKTLIATPDGSIGLVTIPPYHYIRVIYTLQIILQPNTITNTSANITGISTSTGTCQLQYIGLRILNSDGSLGYFDAGLDCNEPSSVVGMFLSRSSSALSAFGSCVDRSSSTTYTKSSINTYFLKGVLQKQAVFSATINDASIMSLGVGTVSAPQTNSGFVLLFNSPLNKQLGYLLSMKFIYTWFAA